MTSPKVTNEQKVTLDDVAVSDDVKQELRKICKLQSKREIEIDEKLNYAQDTGYIFYGPPGTGKTLLAKAIANETKSSFISVSASEFIQRYVGTGPGNIRKLFEKARKNAPCIVFIYEIDSVGENRCDGSSYGHQAYTETLNQLLTELDGFKSREGVIVVDAPNRMGVLDSALTRNGHLSKQINIPLPDENLSEKILNLYMKDTPRTEDLDLTELADETDALGRHRGIDLGGGNDEREQTLNQLLVEMDGFESNEGVIIIAATNRPDVLDPALLRPGRFDRQITISLSDINEREKVLNTHIKKISMAPDVNVKTVARATPGFSGADLANLLNESALIAARRNKKIVTLDDFKYARDKVMMGVERRSLIMTEEEKRLTAYHEAGHAMIAVNMPFSDPIHKATIIPRGRALGFVMRLPETDRVSLTKEKILADITVAIGGRVAEQLIFGYDKVTSGHLQI
nr:unnamed protein product [Callosobruchus chinensis]